MRNRGAWALALVLALAAAGVSHVERRDGLWLLLVVAAVVVTVRSLFAGQVEDVVSQALDQPEPLCGDRWHRPSTFPGGPGFDRVCTLPTGHALTWHDDGSVCWPPLPAQRNRRAQ